LTSPNPPSCSVDASLTFEKHVLDVVRGFHFHIRALRHIRPLLTLDAAKTFAVAIVSSRLDYCNSLLQATSAANLDRLQRVQDVLARVVAQAPWSVSSTDLRRDFHWLPDLTLLLMLFPFLPPPAGTISLRMFDYVLTRPLSNRD